MTVQELYVELREKKEKHLVLSKVFNTVFGRKVRRNEWGFLRRLVGLYGSEVVFWSLVASANISSEGTPLKYVASVCRNMVKEDVKEVPLQASNQDISDLLDYMRNYQQPNWKEILDASD